MKKLLVLLMMLAGFAGQSFAQDAVLDKKTDKLSLMKNAVKYATKADAYSAYCSDKPSSLASDYLDQFYLKKSVTIAQKDELASVMEQEVQAFVEMLQKDQPSCKDMEFMMGRLKVMRKLKDVSYLLNGIDPTTLPPDNIPELEQLILSKDPENSMSPASMQ